MAATGEDDGGEEITIEGVRGFGDDFMTGKKSQGVLRGKVVMAVRRTYEELATALRPVQFDWVFADHQVWIVQLHVGTTRSQGRTIYPGEPSRFVNFDVR